jgi:outer membrane lipoprotein-sorting protein
VSRPMNLVPRLFVLATVALALAASAAPSRAEAPDAGAAPHRPPASPSMPGPAPTPTPTPARDKLEGAKLDPLLAQIAAARNGVRTLRADFTQERKLTLLATTVKSTGDLTFVAPDRLRWALAPPDDIVYLIGPEGLSYRTRSSKATMPARGANIAKALADLRAILGGDLALLRDRYTLTGSRGPDDVEIAGAAKDKTASVRGFVLTLDRTLVLPLKARLIEGKSDAIEITFSNARINVPVDPATMRP